MALAAVAAAAASWCCSSSQPFLFLLLFFISLIASHFSFLTKKGHFDMLLFCFPHFFRFFFYGGGFIRLLQNRCYFSFLLINVEQQKVHTHIHTLIQQSVWIKKKMNKSGINKVDLFLRWWRWRWRFVVVILLLIRRFFSSSFSSFLNINVVLLYFCYCKWERKRERNTNGVDCVTKSSISIV